MRVLLAVDGSACSEAAVQTVIDRFHPNETEVKVIHAVEWMREMPLCFQYGAGPRPDKTWLESRKASFDRAREMVERVAAQLEFKGFQASVSTPDADPRHAIVDAARSVEGRCHRDGIAWASGVRSAAPGKRRRVGCAPCTMFGRYRSRPGGRGRPRRPTIAACRSYVRSAGRHFGAELRSESSRSCRSSSPHVKVDHEYHQHVDGRLAEASRIESPLLAAA